jgi:hypothetical protein
VEPVCVTFQHVRPFSLQKIVMCLPHPLPAEGEGESDGITNFCSSHLSQGKRVLDRAIHPPPTPGYTPRRLEEGEFSLDLVKTFRVTSSHFKRFFVSLC